MTNPFSNLNLPYSGRLQIRVSGTPGFLPIENAHVFLSLTSIPDNTFEEVQTDASGITEFIPLPAPFPENSQTITFSQPYSLYNARIEAEGYQTLLITGIQILPNQDSILPVTLFPYQNPIAQNDIVISAHTLFGNYPAKIPESEFKPMEETGQIVLNSVVIPETIVVHDGAPSDSTATNYYVPYKDYIKNVASSEVYATWPESTIYANILAIMSFTLNRVYTEWYRSKGYSFTITSSTAYDQKWMYGRNIYENISQAVDSIFSNYLVRPGRKQPLFASYCDGSKVSCSGLSQWGSKTLGEEGYSAIEILRYYYGNDLNIATATTINGIPASYPGSPLSIGSSGSKVSQLQEQLNRISQNYPAIPKLTVDGAYGPATANSIRVFQQVFNLPVTGVTDFATWYRLSDIYVGVSKLSEPGR